MHTCQRQLIPAHLLNSCIYRQVSCPQGKCQETTCFKDTPSHRHDEDESSGAPKIQKVPHLITLFPPQAYSLHSGRQGKSGRPPSQRPRPRRRRFKVNFVHPRLPLNETSKMLIAVPQPCWSRTSSFVTKHRYWKASSTTFSAIWPP